MRDEEKLDDMEESLSMRWLFSEELEKKINMLAEVSSIGWEIKELYSYTRKISNCFLEGARKYPHLGLRDIASDQESLKRDEKQMWELLEKLYAEDKIISDRQKEIKHWKNYGYTKFDEFIVEENDG